MKQRVAIIGAGISGLATANLLSRAGYQVDIYEQSSQPGGRMGWIEKDGFSFDTGPSWYLMPEVFRHFYDLIGVDINQEIDLLKLDPAYKVFFESAEPILIRSDMSDAKTKFEEVETGAGKKVTDYVKRSREVYDLALKHFLYTNFSLLSDWLKWDIIRRSPRLIRLVVRSMDEEVSKSFKDQRLKQILEYSAVFLGASPYEAPAIYTLMSALDFTDGVYYPKGGMYQVIRSMENLAIESGVNLHFNASVQQITVKQGQVAGLYLKSGQEVKADIVISAADLHHTETVLLEPQYQTYPQKYWQKRNPGPSAFLLYLGVKGELPKLEHHTLFFVDDWQENFTAIYQQHQIPESASIYVSKASASDPNLAPPGHESLVVLVPFPAGVDVDESLGERLATRFIRQLSEMTDIADLADRIISKTIIGPNDFAENFNSWQSTALGPAHTLKQSAIFRTRNISKKVKNLYYVGHSTIPGIGVPMCLISAELIYKRLAGDKRGGQVEKLENIGDQQ